jgi:hypothetical protein
VRSAVTAVALLLVLVAATLALERQVHGAAQVVVHAALLLPAGVAMFWLRLLQPYDMKKLAELPLERAWSRALRTTALWTLGVFARLAGVRGLA